MRHLDLQEAWQFEYLQFESGIKSVVWERDDVLVSAVLNQSTIGGLCHPDLMIDDESTWTDEDDAMVTYESLPEWHPALFVDVFRTALEVDQPETNHLLFGAFVTPESVGAWGDFSRARAIFASGLKIGTSAFYGIGAADVAYVRLVETDAHINHDIHAAPATMHVTLVWRPEIAVVPNSSWRIHHLGDEVEPSLVPRSAPGFDPRDQS